MKPQFSRKNIITNFPLWGISLRASVMGRFTQSGAADLEALRRWHMGTQKMEWHGVPISGLINGENWTYNAYKWSYKLFHPTDFALIYWGFKSSIKWKCHLFFLLKSKIPSLLGNSWKAIVEQMVEHSICGTPEIWGNLRFPSLTLRLQRTSLFLKMGGWRKKTTSLVASEKCDVCFLKRCCFRNAMLCCRCLSSMEEDALHTVQKAWKPRSLGQDGKVTRKLVFTHFGRIKECKFMAIFRDFP